MPDNYFRLGAYKLFRADRSTANYKTKHGGVLIEQADNIHFGKMTLNINSEVKAVKISCNVISVILCCV